MNALHVRASDGATPFGVFWETLRGRSTHAGIVRELDTVHLPKELVASPGAVRDAAVELRIFAEMAEEFRASFCHPAETPWAAVPFSNVEAHDAREFLGALTAMKASTEDTLALISLDPEVEIADVGDFVSIEKLDAALTPAPEPETIQRVSQLDLHGFQDALAIRSDMLAIEAELDAMSDVSDEDPDRLAMAAAHLRSRASADFLEETPASAYRKARRDTAALERVADAIDGILPALDELGLGLDAGQKFGGDRNGRGHRRKDAACNPSFVARIPRGERARSGVFDAPAASARRRGQRLGLAPPWVFNASAPAS